MNQYLDLGEKESSKHKTIYTAGESLRALRFGFFTRNKDRKRKDGEEFVKRNIAEGFASVLDGYEFFLESGS